jgi:hypothetical protein
MPSVRSASRLILGSTMNTSDTTRRSRPRRLAVLAVATTLAAGAGTAQAAPAFSSAPAQPAAHWVVVPETAAAVKPPASVIAFAHDLGVDTDFAWRTLDELSRGR